MLKYLIKHLMVVLMVIEIKHRFKSFNLLTFLIFLNAYNRFH